MGDRFVDVSYRGLEIGRQLKLRDVTTEGAYLESTTPMPVGSPIEVIIDDGTRLVAMVASVHEQVAGGPGGSDAPGMRIRPVASGAAARRWWDAQPEPPPRATPAAPPVAADTPPPAIVEVAPPTVAAAVDEPSAPINGAAAAHDSGEPTIDSTSSSDAIPAVGGGDVSSSGELEAVDASDDDEPSESSGSRPIETHGTNGHGDKGGARKKSKTGKRRKRNTR